MSYRFLVYVSAIFFFFLPHLIYAGATISSWTAVGGNQSWTSQDSGQTLRGNNNTTQLSTIVSDDNFIGGDFEARMWSTNGDDDTMGVVVGHQAPLATGGSRLHKTFIMTWTRNDGSHGSDDGSSPDRYNYNGIRLYYIDGNYDDPGITTATSTTGYIAHSAGAWSANSSGSAHVVRIRYTESELIFTIDGVERISIVPSDAGLTEFVTGRIGIVTYSQPNVYFSQLTPLPTALPDVVHVNPFSGNNAFSTVKANDLEPNSAWGANNASVVTNPSSGTLSLNADGTGTYTRSVGTSYSTYLDSFTYKLTNANGGISDTVTVSLNVNMNAPFTGSHF